MLNWSYTYLDYLKRSKALTNGIVASQLHSCFIIFALFIHGFDFHIDTFKM